MRSPRDPCRCDVILVVGCLTLESTATRAPQSTFLPLFAPPRPAALYEPLVRVLFADVGGSDIER